MTTVQHRGLAPVRAALDNGAVVTAKESRVTPAITIHAALHAGTIADPAPLPGVANFVARTIDRGTLTRAADAIAEDLDSRGVSLTIAVNRHVLTLVCTCLVEDFRDVLSVVADVIINPRFPANEVETRRREIITQIGQDQDNPAAVASERLMELLYGESHPYGRRGKGTVESVERIDAAVLQELHRAHVTPRGLSLVLVGDIDPREAIDRANEAFAGWGASGAEPVLPAPPPPHDTRQVSVVAMPNKAQADIAYGFTSITRSDPAYYAYWVMNNILGQYSLGGRLGDNIRERQGMAYYVFSALDANIIPGPLLIRAGVNPSNVERTVASIDAELTKLRQEGPTDQEISESKRYLIGSLPRNLETNIGIANFLQTSEFFKLGLDYDVRIPELLDAVSRDDVHAAARATLDPARAAVAVAGPYDGPLT